jgi:hypothetical protein
MGEIGILAPRGWHCLGLSGSNGSFLVVTPERHRAQEYFNEGPVAIRGPAVQSSLSYGGTSGRYAVAKTIARYFPAWKDFVQQVIEMDRSIGALPIEPLPTRPYKSDVIKRRTANYLRFTTPAGKNGEGTNSRLLPGVWPIEGFRKVVGPAGEPDLIGTEVRLPQTQANLIETILSEAAK